MCSRTYSFDYNQIRWGKYMTNPLYQGKKAIITGGTQGLGEAIARKLTEEYMIGDASPASAPPVPQAIRW